MSLIAVQNAPLLRRLAQSPLPETVVALAAELGRDKSNVSKSLASLHEEGLLTSRTLGPGMLSTTALDLIPRLDVLDGTRRMAEGQIALRHGEIEPDPLNPRKAFSGEEITELADSIAAKGLLQSLAVKPPTDDAGAYRIIAGERRWRAIRQLIQRGAWPAERLIPCNLVEGVDEEEHEELALIENVQRQDLNKIEEAEAIERLIARGRTVGEVAKAAGKTRRWVEKRRQLLTCPAIVQLQVREGAMSLEKALEFVKTPKPEGEAAEAGSEPEAAPVVQAAGGIELFAEQALMMIEVAHLAADPKRGDHSSLGPVARLDRAVNLAKDENAEAMAAEGLLSFAGGWPPCVTILRPGRDWLQANGFPAMDPTERLRRARDDAGLMAEEIERLEAEGRYWTPWLNLPPKAKAPEVDDATALTLLEIFDATQEGPDAYWAPIRWDYEPATIKALGNRVFTSGSPHSGYGGRHTICLNADARQVLAGRWPDYQDVEARKAHLAALRIAVRGEKSGGKLNKAGEYATPWLRQPIKPDPEWVKRKAEEKAAVERQEAEARAKAEWRAQLAEAVDVFQTQALDMDEAEIRRQYRDLLNRANASAPWRPSDNPSSYAISAVDGHVGLQGSPVSQRLAIIGVNIAAGIPAEEWAVEPLAEAEDAKRAATSEGEYIGWIAEALVENHGVDEGAAADRAFTAYRDEQGASAAEFGDPNYGWSRGDASTTADEYAAEYLLQAKEA